MAVKRSLVGKRGTTTDGKEIAGSGFIVDPSAMGGHESPCHSKPSCRVDEVTKWRSVRFRSSEEFDQRRDIAWPRRMTTAGSISYAAMAEAVRVGCARASTDTGHAGGRGTFALDHPEKLVDFAWRRNTK
jgi:hypothetical protein